MNSHPLTCFRGERIQACTSQYKSLQIINFLHLPETGKERDRESGLDYFGARFYDKQLGMWISVDEQRQFANLFGYDGNGTNPLNTIDKTGFEKVYILVNLNNSNAIERSSITRSVNNIASDLIKKGQSVYLRGLENSSSRSDFTKMINDPEAEHFYFIGHGAKNVPQIIFSDNSYVDARGINNPEAEDQYQVNGANTQIHGTIFACNQGKFQSVWSNVMSFFSAPFSGKLKMSDTPRLFEEQVDKDFD